MTKRYILIAIYSLMMAAIQHDDTLLSDIPEYSNVKYNVSLDIGESVIDTPLSEYFADC